MRSWSIGKRIAATFVSVAMAMTAFASSPLTIEHYRGTAFAWSAEFNSMVDMSANDMSSLGFNIMAGVRHGWLHMAGVGAGADITLNNPCRSFPLYVCLRTNFCNRPTRFFVDLRAGIAVNYLEDDTHITGQYGSAGIGFNLAQGASYSSYIMLGYTFMERGENPDLHLASLRLGVTF